MKKQTIRLLALMLSLICVLSACGKKQTNTPNESPKNQTEENSIEDNKNVYGDSGNSGNSGDSPSLAPGSRIYCRSMDEYLEAKSNSGFSVEEGWIPWEQFSFLGDFKKSYWIKGSAGSAQYG